MFTAVAFVAIAAIGWLAQRHEGSERLFKPTHIDDDAAKQQIGYIRQDIRIICYLLVAILLALAIIADIQSGR